MRAPGVPTATPPGLAIPQPVNGLTPGTLKSIERQSGLKLR